MGFRKAIQRPEQWARQELAPIVDAYHVDACLHHQEHRLVNAIRDRLVRRLPYGTKFKRICDLIDVDEYLKEHYGKAPSPTFAKMRGMSCGVDVESF